MRAFQYTGLLVYFLTAMAAFFWWAPQFFTVNTHLPVEMTYRYTTASGVPMGIFLISVVARQALMPRFSLVLVNQVLLTGGLLWCALYAFYSPPQANFFASMHLLSATVCTLWNFYQYRRTLLLIERYRAAEE